MLRELETWLKTKTMTQNLFPHYRDLKSQPTIVENKFVLSSAFRVQNAVLTMATSGRHAKKDAAVICLLVQYWIDEEQ